LRRVLDQLAAGERDQQRQAVRVTLLHPCQHRMVNGGTQCGTEIVEVQELRIWPQQLRSGDVGLRERPGLHERLERIGRQLQELVAKLELIGGQLVQLRSERAIGKFRALVSDVGYFNRDIAGQLALHVQVPLLRIPHARASVDGAVAAARAEILADVGEQPEPGAVGF